MYDSYGKGLFVWFLCACIGKFVMYFTLFFITCVHYFPCEKSLWSINFLLKFFLNTEDGLKNKI